MQDEKLILVYRSVSIIQVIIQKKSASGSWTLPCHAIFFGNLILIWKCQKWSLNRGTLVSATAIYQTKFPFTVLSALFFRSSVRCPMILDYSLISQVPFSKIPSLKVIFCYVMSWGLCLFKFLFDLHIVLLTIGSLNNSYEHDEKGGLVQFSDNYIIKACVRYFLWNF